MATYKAEFLSHYYAGRLRPRAAYSMGLIFRWSRLAMLAPGLVNATLRAPVLGRAVKWLAGFTPERAVPAYAAETFQTWWRRRRSPRTRDANLPPVILWPDTFSNYFLPGTLKAAVIVLEDAGYRVMVPTAPLCCGRPLYDYGMLDLARTKLLQILEQLRPAIRAGVPLVALEPSCLSVFRDEMPNLLAGEEDAERLSLQAKTLSELLLATPDWHPPQMKLKALVQTHCHHKAVLEPESEQKLLHAMGLDIERPPVGCCGHAGSFGFEAEHQALSMRIGELVLLPAVRKAPPEALIISDGFSCRHQIRDGTGRWAMHPAEVIALALESRRGLPPTHPERRYLDPPAAPPPALLLGILGLGLAAGVLAWRAASRRSA
jgi:Fe-S oxidoreductase